MKIHEYENELICIYNTKGNVFIFIAFILIPTLSVYVEDRLIFIVSRILHRFFAENLVLINIHEYANELICIFIIKIKGNIYALTWY